MERSVMLGASAQHTSKSENVAEGKVIRQLRWSKWGNRSGPDRREPIGASTALVVSLESMSSRLERQHAAVWRALRKKRSGRRRFAPMREE